MHCCTAAVAHTQRRQDGLGRVATPPEYLDFLVPLPDIQSTSYELPSPEGDRAESKGASSAVPYTIIASLRHQLAVHQPGRTSSSSAITSSIILALVPAVQPNPPRLSRRSRTKATVSMLPDCRQRTSATFVNRRPTPPAFPSASATKTGSVQPEPEPEQPTPEQPTPEVSLPLSLSPVSSLDATSPPLQSPILALPRHLDHRCDHVKPPTTPTPDPPTIHWG